MCIRRIFLSATFCAREPLGSNIRINSKNFELIPFIRLDAIAEIIKVVDSTPPPQSMLAAERPILKGLRKIICLLRQ